MENKERHSRLEFHRIAVAARDIECAAQGFQLILELNCEPADNRYQTLLFGAVISYARPFTSNDGFGSLPKKWQKFYSHHLQEKHAEIIEYRNTVAAHSDIKHNKLYIYPRGNILQIGEKSHFLDEPAYAITTPLLTKDEIPRYIELCQYQHTRLLDATIEFIKGHYTQESGPFEFNYKE